MPELGFKTANNIPRFDRKFFESSEDFTIIGEGSIDSIYDIVYVSPDTFNTRDTRTIAYEIEQFNRRLIREERLYLLIGFGRWGSSDSWLGIPVNWSQISASRVIVEATLPEMNVDLSQGSNFFHNLTSFGVPYFSVKHDKSRSRIMWEWLNKQKPLGKTNFARHVRLQKPLTVLVDGRKGEGVIYHG